MGKVVPMTVHGGEPDAVIEEGRRLQSRVGASSGSVHVRVGADDGAVLATLDTERNADAMITLRGANGDVVSQLQVPPGSWRLVQNRTPTGSRPTKVRPRRHRRSG